MKSQKSRSLDAETAEFDKEMIIDSFRPLTPGERKQCERARCKRGRPRVGDGSKPISVTIEKALLREADKLAKQQKTTRARLIARGLQSLLTKSRRAAD